MSTRHCLLADLRNSSLLMLSTTSLCFLLYLKLRCDRGHAARQDQNKFQSNYCFTFSLCWGIVGLFAVGLTQFAKLEILLYHNYPIKS